MTARFVKTICLLAVILFSISCEEEETKPLKNNASVRFIYGSEKSTKTYQDITFNEAFIYLEKVTFNSLELEDEDVDMGFSGNYEVDLLNDVCVPSLPLFGLNSGQYEYLDMVFDDEVSPNVLISGTAVLAADETINFVFYSDIAIDFEYTSDDKELEYLFEVYENDEVDVVVKFQLNDWFYGSDLTSGEKDSENVVIISKDSNVHLYDQIIANAKASSLVVVDGNF